MARSGVAKTKMLFLRELEKLQGWRSLSKVAAGTEGETAGRRDTTGWTTDGGGGDDRKGCSRGADSAASSWVPHPRTGIYFPKGHDHVMEDVPEGAACFEQTCWFRTVEGVDKPDHDHDVSTQY